MQVQKVYTLRGPNYWANFTVLEVWVDLGPWKDISSEMMPGFNERLMGWLPTMIEHRCSVGTRGGFFERLRRGTYLAHILEHVTLELQTLAGANVGFGRARETNVEGVYRVAIEYTEEAVGKLAIELGRELCMAAVEGKPFDVDAAVEKLQTLLYDARLGPSTNSIVEAARERGIPARRLNDGSLVQFGHGKRQRRILAAETDRTSAIGENIAQDKQLTRKLLAGVGAPVPEGWPVESLEAALEAAEEIGYPVVVKPQYGNQGRGVAVNLRSKEQVEAAYAAAREESSSIIVEKHVEGGDYRVLVVGDKVVAVAHREPAHVIGDGVLSVAGLVDVANEDPRRSDGHATVLSKIKIDAIAEGVLAAQGLTAESVPAAGQVVLIRRNANLSTGGTAADVTDRVHPLLAQDAVLAAKVVGLDVAGVDIVATGIDVPLEESRGAIVEVNAAPGLRMHLQPSAGTPRAVGKAIIDSMFAPGENGRIPIVAVTGTNGKTTTTRLVAHMFAQAGHFVGMTCTDGVYLGHRRIDDGDCSGPQSARKVLAHPMVDAAVLETARGGILREGLAFDQCDVAVVTNLADGDHLGLHGIDTLEKLARVKRTIVDVVAPTGAAVLKADDPFVAEMAQKCPGSVIFFALDIDHPMMARRRAEGQRVVSVRDRNLVLVEGQMEIELMPLADIPLTHGGRIGFQVENAMAASAAAWAAGLPLDIIREGLRTFSSRMDKVPGRFNLVDVQDATILFDYGHNCSSLLALLEVLDQFPHPRRTVVYSAAGDRRDEDMIRQGQLLAGAFDCVILYEDHYIRGRKPGEITALFRQGLSGGQRVKDVHDVQGWEAAVELAIGRLQPGDLLHVQADQIDQTVEYVRRRLGDHGAVREVQVSDAMQTAEANAPAKHAPANHIVHWAPSEKLVPHG